MRAGLALAMLLFAAGPAAAADVKAALDASDVGTIWFASAGSLNWPDPEAAYQRGEPVALSGELELPDGAGPFPVVVLAHGCNGITGGETAWKHRLYRTVQVAHHDSNSTAVMMP